MKEMQVLLLGPPEVRFKDQMISVQRRIPRALLFYLASQGGMVGRDQLLPMFWENEPDVTARRRLSDTLSRLRKALPDPQLLQANPSLVGLNFSNTYVDQLEFQSLIDQAGRLPWRIPADKPLPDRTYRLLHKAAGLWRSSNFLAGANFPGTPELDNWLSRTTQKMEHQLGRVLERLSDHAFSLGDLEQAIQMARRALLADELNEDLHYRVLQCYIKLGRSSEAREYFDYLQDLLRRELDITPSPQLVDLYRQVRVGAPSRPIPDIQAKWNIRQSVETPFVGRKATLEQLQRAYHKGGATLIFGESGQGKTRLLQEFTARLKPPPRLLVTNCRPAESNLPFQPIIELLRHHILPDEWLALPVVWASQLTLLLPDLTSMRPDLERPIFEVTHEVAPGQARALLLEAIRQVFLQLSGEYRLLLCLDDAQWSDEATLATLAYLLERPPFDQSAFLVLAARREEYNPHLERFLTSLAQYNLVNTLNLSRLEVEDIANLVRFILGQAPSSQFTSDLADETSGNPFFILETLRSFLENEVQLDPGQSISMPLATSIQALIHARLDKLSSTARGILEVAAIIGPEFDPEVVVEVSQSRAMKVANALDELEQRLLVEPANRSPESPRYRFIHDKIQEAARQRINPLRARLLHERVARSLENRGGDQAPEQAAVLAQHYELAGQVTAAFAYWVRAGHYARQLFSIADATQAFQRAESLIDRAPDLVDDQIYNLYSEWTEMAYETDDVETIRRLNTDLLAAGKARNSALLTGTALDGLSDACMASDQFEAGLDYANQSIPYLEKTGNLFEHMEAYNHRGVFLYMLNQIEAAIESFQDALTLGANSQDLRVLGARANAHYQIAVARTLSGWPKIGLTHALRSLDDFKTVNRPHGQVTAYSALALSRYFLGEYEQARKDSELGIYLAERDQAWRMLGYLHGYRGMIELATGNLEAALLDAERTIQLGENHGHNEIAAGGYRIIGDGCTSLGAHQQAAEFYQRALQISQDSFLIVDQMFRLGWSLCQIGQQAEGIKLVEQVIEITRQANLGIILIQAQTVLLLIYRMNEDWNQAKALRESLQAEVDQREIPSLQLMLESIAGEDDLRVGERARALDTFRRVAKKAASLPHLWLELKALKRIDKTLSLVGQPDPATIQRIHLLLDQIEGGLTRPDYRRYFQNFRQNMLGPQLKQS